MNHSHHHANQTGNSRGNHASQNHTGHPIEAASEYHGDHAHDAHGGHSGHGHHSPAIDL